MPRSIATVVGNRLATLVELDTVLGAKDLYMLLEIAAVEAYNAQPQED